MRYRWKFWMWLWRLAETKLYDGQAYYVRLSPADYVYLDGQKAIRVCAHSPPCPPDSASAVQSDRESA